MSFSKAVESIYNCKGKVICSGVGKSGLIGRKISATLSSIGISSFFLNPSEANHGDLGQIDKKDILLVFSYSGNTVELSNNEPPEAASYHCMFSPSATNPPIVASPQNV